MPGASLALRGSIPALVTPFRAGDGELDEPALGRLAERAVAQGSAAVVVCGSTGEAAAMTAAEQARAIRTVVEAVGRRCPVIAGIGAPCTAGAVALARAAERCGADALLCAAPPYVKPNQDGLRAHLRAAAGAAALPVVLYDVPARTGVGFDDDTVARLWEDGVIHALKDATADLARPTRLRRLCGAELPQLSGDDATAAAHLAMGGSGCISVTANVVPDACAALQRAWAEGDRDALAALRDGLAPLHEALFAESNPIPVKAALGLLGLCDPAPRLPLTRATEATVRRLDAVLRDFGATGQHAAPARRAG
ncbi:4-hydroxy-tetrahydrodipicolinate synthase [Roseomonas sp. BN140053]|uniref:4-hydroxy-tetrahydrodipicolinate synthase n=1 Tax=Roseomonas sp. BN140053 TaxID=3391898 RepID=UPI0039ECAE92